MKLFIWMPQHSIPQHNQDLNCNTNRKPKKKSIIVLKKSLKFSNFSIQKSTAVSNWKPERWLSATVSTDRKRFKKKKKKQNPATMRVVLLSYSMTRLRMTRETEIQRKKKKNKKKRWVSEWVSVIWTRLRFHQPW